MLQPGHQLTLRNKLEMLKYFKGGNPGSGRVSPRLSQSVREAILASATTSAMCLTLTLLPRLSMPPFSWSTQPGQSVTSSSAPVSSTASSFFLSSSADSSGKSTEKVPAMPQHMSSSRAGRYSRPAVASRSRGASVTPRPRQRWQGEW